VLCPLLPCKAQATTGRPAQISGFDPLIRRTVAILSIDWSFPITETDITISFTVLSCHPFQLLSRA